ncbi:PREDICTED: agrin-like [Acropora digitifera]|uniref:agrin-like n=1 Tax=Acropora digitifera TaxID=70779 RepID=UPI000779F1AB|nr:PREDICTED: agrin-like [Acropora digitifera]
MRFQSTNIRKTSQITIRFKAGTVNGILFYSGYRDQSDKGDFLSIYLHNGFIKLRYNLGSGTGEARSNSSIDLNTWYTVSVNREDKNATLTVSGDTPISVISPGTAVSLNVPSSFYLGGVPTLSAINPNAVDSFVQDFVGCIDMFMVNNILYMQASTGALEGRNIANCPASPQRAL